MKQKTLYYLRFFSDSSVSESSTPSVQYRFQPFEIIRTLHEMNQSLIHNQTQRHERWYLFLYWQVNQIEFINRFQDLLKHYDWQGASNIISKLIKSRETNIVSYTNFSIRYFNILRRSVEKKKHRKTSKWAAATFAKTLN